MRGKNITKRSLDEILEEDRTRPDAPEGPKKQITLRLDSDMVEWFKEKGKGYQTLMNSVLRSYFETFKKSSPK